MDIKSERTGGRRVIHDKRRKEVRVRHRMTDMEGDMEIDRRRKLLRDLPSKEHSEINLTYYSRDLTINTYHWKAFTFVSSRLLGKRKKKNSEVT